MTLYSSFDLHCRVFPHQSTVSYFLQIQFRIWTAINCVDQFLFHLSSVNKSSYTLFRHIYDMKIENQNYDLVGRKYVTLIAI